MDMEVFCKELPKIELHAHLNGSLSRNTLMTLQKFKLDDPNLDKTFVQNFQINRGHSLTLSECFELFKIAHALTDTPHAVKIAVSLTLKEFCDDGVVYLELRSTPRSNNNMTKSEYVQAMIDAVIESSTEISMITRLIISIDRRNTLEDANDTVNLAIQMAQKYPNVVVGLDLSGDPRAKTFNEFQELLNIARVNGIKTTVHTAEIPSIEETFEILKWKPNRLGHVTCNSEKTMGSRELWENILLSKIPIEICMTSNVKSGTVKTYDVHHFKSFFEANHPISIGTDDKGVFDTDLSKEFLLCAQIFGLNKVQLWELSFKTVSQIFADELTKTSLTKKFLVFKNKIMMMDK